MRALDPARYQILPVAITTDGVWVQGPGDPEDLAGGKVRITSGREVTLVRTAAGTVELRALGADGSDSVLSEVDVVFPVLHGPFGEDGTVQGFFDILGVRYVGSGVAASAMCMDKHLTKVSLAAAGFEIEPYVAISDARWQTDKEGALAEAAQLKTPIFVKPVRAGSSLGITRVDDVSGLEAAIEEARRHDPKVIVEQGVAGREIECGVLGPRAGGDGKPRAALAGEVVVEVPEGGFYDFETKYFSDADTEINRVPAEITPEQMADIRQQAIDAFSAMGCEGLARVDFFLRPDGTAVINEINTMPGFTPFSMFPVMWQGTGMTYAELVDDLIAQAMERRVGLR